MVKYRCIKADRFGGVHWDSRPYIENGIHNARKRAMKMIHGDKRDSVLIWNETEYKNKPWIGYTEKVVISDKRYITYTAKDIYILNPDGSTKGKL